VNILGTPSRRSSQNEPSRHLGDWMARSIQQASLPKEVPKLEGWHLAPYYRYAREVTSTTSTYSLRENRGLR
jgi:hypothetical protein